MNNLFKAAVAPVIAQLVQRSNLPGSGKGGFYAGIDVLGGGTFAGTQARITPEGAPVRIVPSVEGDAAGTAGRWQANADVLAPLGSRPAAWKPYAGGGLCLVGGSEKESRSLGINLIGGLGVAFGPLDGFVQARLTVADGVHLSLTLGANPAS